MTLNATTALNALYTLLHSPERVLPVIVVSEFRRFPPPFPGIKGTVMVDDAGLATQVKGAAIVVRLPYDLVYQWTNMVGKEWSCFGGACRIYTPGLSFEDDDYRQHPLYMNDKIWWWRDETNRTGQEAFFDWLVSAQWRQNAFSKFSWRGLYFVPEASVLLSELTADRSREAAEVGDFVAEQRRIAQQMQTMAAQATADCDAWLEEGERQLKQIEHYKRIARTCGTKMMHYAINLSVKMQVIYCLPRPSPMTTMKWASGRTPTLLGGSSCLGGQGAS